MPTPVGPRNMNTPDGRSGSESPALDVRTARATARHARPWPSTRDFSFSSSSSNCVASSPEIRSSGIPVHCETVDIVLGFYGDKPSQWLSDLTHMEAPWRKARERAGLADGERGNAVITHALMAEYYDSL